MELTKRILAAGIRIRPHIRKTPLENAFTFSKEAGCNLFLKLENMQYTGSFKARGAINRLILLDPEEKKTGVVTASTGNHGLATAYGLGQLGIPGTIFLPLNASSEKIAMFEPFDVDLEFFAKDCGETESHAREQAKKRGKVYISPYNDPDVIAGQGTIGLEIIDQLDGVDCIMASVGGGGLISGIAAMVKAIKTDVKVIGCLPEQSPVMYDSVRAGRIVSSTPGPTISDGTAGGIEKNSITLNPCKNLVDDWILVSEEEIRTAMKLVFERQRLVIEGAAGVAVAAFLKTCRHLEKKTVAVVICGGNIDPDLFKSIVC